MADRRWPALTGTLITDPAASVSAAEGAAAVSGLGAATGVGREAGAALAARDHDRGLAHPRLAFVERLGDERPEGVVRPPTHGPSTAGPTSGAWGSG